MENETQSSLPLFTKVEISGRTMLAPGFSLVGLTGIVYMPAPNAPVGCVTVMIDWLTHGYTPENGYEAGTLPQVVNVPAIHLKVIDPNAPIEPEETKPAKTKAAKPQLKVLKEEPAKKEAPKDDSSDEERPKLRLV